ncbi:MAG: alpha/beta hydrolase [bacterium]|nr:alpha/beta hydrolase [bacterium]MDD5354537.1 alpha/beta hydrolase [bacterium]MDD5756766.1 alpha/beta hydrolase [bacterium]
MTNYFNIHVNVWTSIVVIIVVLTIIWGWGASRLILTPPRYDLDTKPSELNMSYEDVTFSSTDGIQTIGFFIPGQKTKPTVIVLHGYGTNKSDILNFAEMLHHHDYNVLVFDFRGHGQTKGKCTLGYNETRDLSGAVNYLMTRKDIDQNKIGVLGCSMGANVAIIGAANDQRIKAIVADSGFASFEKTVTRFAKLFYNLPKYPFVPPAIWFAELRAGFNAKKADATKYIGKISPRAVFIIGGANDVRIPPVNQDDLFKAAGEPKQLWIAPEADHLEARGLWPREYERKVMTFFDKYLK